jgi:hypothetical protein
MSNSASPIHDALVQSQASKEVTVNAALDAMSPALLFGRRQSSSSGLTWGYYGGTINVAGVLTAIANGTVALTASATNYVESNGAGSVTANTSGFTAGRIPLYTVVTGSASVSSYTDHRISIPLPGVAVRFVKAMANANQTLTANESRAAILEATGALTALRDLIVPIGAQQWTVFANVTGGFGIRVIGPSGTGITIADGKRAIVYADGTNIVRVTPDT